MEGKMSSKGLKTRDKIDPKYKWNIEAMIRDESTIERKVVKIHLTICRCPAPPHKRFYIVPKFQHIGIVNGTDAPCPYPAIINVGSSLEICHVCTHVARPIELAKFTSIVTIILMV